MRKLALLVLASSLVVACSSSSSPSGGGDYRSAKASSASRDQLAAFCDAVAAKTGGYGAPKKTVQCDANSTATFESSPDQASCIAGSEQGLQSIPAACPITLGQLEDCTEGEYADLCSANPPGCSGLSDPACQTSTNDAGTTD